MKNKFGTVGKLGKKRTILDKDDYKVIKQEGNIYMLKNVRTGEKIYKPRFEIKSACATYENKI